MGIKDIKIFQSKAFQNVPKLEVWFENKPSGNPGLNAVNVLRTHYLHILGSFTLQSARNNSLVFLFRTQKS
jgi:hypothetical protein